MAAKRSLPPSTNWEEKYLPDERDLFDKFAHDILGYQKQDAEGGKLLRGFHAKIHLGFLAEFQVMADLPEHARHGVFAEPRTFPALVRFSNGSSHIQRDSEPEPRGIAIKLVGVEGRKLLPGQEDAVTQDFLATSHSVTATVRDITQFIAFVKAERHGPVAILPGLMRELPWRGAFRIWVAVIRTVVLSKVRSMATEEFSGTAPIKFGPYAVKFTVRPAQATGGPVEHRSERDFLREELAARLRKTDLVFDFWAQFYTDDVGTPIEDTSVPWLTEDAPPLKVAQLRIPRCDVDKFPAREQSEKIDGLSFSPWHAIDDHRPLGNVMRARRVAYEASAAHRGHAAEPKSIPL